MKIGVLTFHRAINYGAVLQAFALQQVLKGLGHDACVIDYRQHRVEGTDRRPFREDDRYKLIVSGHLRSWWNFEKNKARILERRQRFDRFLEKYLNITAPCDNQNIPDFDLYVIGSDQVWNSAICDGLDSVYWGCFSRPNESRIISYAASTSVKDLQKQEPTLIQSYLDNFSHVTVREQTTCDYLNNAFRMKKPAQTVLDPTLLASKDTWNLLSDNKADDEDYVLFFEARSSSRYPNVLRDMAEDLAKKYQCKIKSIEFDNDSPEDFVNKFRYAKAIVTSSFHGTAFSLIFNRPLYAVMYGDEQDARYVNVLKSIGADDMLVKMYQNISPRDFDYSEINKRMEGIRKKSLEFLKSL
jgi:hypothetical protein